jgi:RNA polymerase sigma-70 factor (ECF subfamily)
MSFDPTPANEYTAPDGPAPVARALLDELARRYYAPLLSFFRKRTRNAPEAQDLVQQVFLRLAQHTELRTIQNPYGYIFQTAANALKDHYRRDAVRERLRVAVSGAEQSWHADFSPDRVLQGHEALVRLTEALRTLPERTRDVFMLRCFEGLKHTEIARLLGISVRSVEKHVAKALSALSRVLDESGGGVP